MPIAESGSARRLVFLEERAHALWVKKVLRPERGTKLVALTAEAVQAAEEMGLEHESISSVATLRGLSEVDEQINVESFALAQEIEAFIRRGYPGLPAGEPGFLSGHGYYLQYAVSFVVTRALLMRQAIRAFGPRVVTVFDGEVDPWFAGDGYVRNPWLEVLAEFAPEHGFELETLPRLPRLRTTAGRSTRFAGRAYQWLRRRSSDVLSRFDPSGERLAAAAADLRGLRLVWVDSAGYDWQPAVRALRALGGAKGWILDGRDLGGREWTHHYLPRLRPLLGATRPAALGDPFMPDSIEARKIGTLFDDFAQERPPSGPQLHVLGMNLFPALRLHLRTVASQSPALMRHTDTVVNGALDAARPQAICTYAMPGLAVKRLAYQCRQRGIPVVCYQHGGTYGTHFSPKNEQIELAHADYFLTYGRGIRYRTNPAFPRRARYVPVGSARLETQLIHKPRMRPRKGSAIRVLWVAEISTRNLLGGTFQVEDTERYAIEKQCLEILGTSRDVRVTYRPYASATQWDGITRWLRCKGPRSVRVDVSRPLVELIHKNDLVITDTSSGTVWNEVVALKKPLILYCDPEQVRLLPHFGVDLEQMCSWCKTRSAVVEAVSQLVARGHAFIDELRKRDASNFLQQYVLGPGDGRSAERVIFFLNGVCRHGLAVEDWQRSYPG